MIAGHLDTDRAQVHMLSCNLLCYSLIHSASGMLGIIPLFVAGHLLLTKGLCRPRNAALKQMGCNGIETLYFGCSLVRFRTPRVTDFWCRLWTLVFSVHLLSQSEWKSLHWPKQLSQFSPAGPSRFWTQLRIWSVLIRVFLMLWAGVAWYPLPIALPAWCH